MLLKILNWSEVWATFVPLSIYIIKRPRGKYLNFIAFYLFISLLTNSVIDVSWIFNLCVPILLKNNNFLYNINSVIRVIIFIYFFRSIIYFFEKKFFDLLLTVYLLFFLTYFFINKNFSYLSSFLHTTESSIILILCITYFISLIKSDEVFFYFNPYLIIASGLAIYESVNFFIFLFYQYLAKSPTMFAHNIWYIFDVAFIILCLSIARAFFGRLK